MKTATTQIFSFSIFALLLSGCYTQLEVVERQVHHYDRYERPAPNRAYNPQDEYRLDEHAYTIDGFSEESYVAGYDDGFADVELYFRDFSRQPVFGNTNQYALGYRDGYRDAAWTYNRHRFHSRYASWHWDPYWHSGWHAGWHSGWHSSFHVSWGWHRPHSFWYGSPYHFHGFYAHPVYFHGFHPHYGWGVHRNTWIVYNYNVINNTNVNRGPRNSGIQRDRYNNTRNVATTGNRTDARPNTSATRSSGVSRDNTGVQRGTANTNTGRSRGTVTRSPSTDGRTSGTTRSGVRDGGSSSGSSGSVQRGTTTGRSSGTVRSGGNRSGGNSSSGNTTRRPRGNEMQSSNQLPAVSPGSTNSRERLIQNRPAVQQPPRTTTQTRANVNTHVRTTHPASQVGRSTASPDDNRPTAVPRATTNRVQPSAGSTVTRTETASPGRVGNTGTVQQRNSSPANTSVGTRPAPRQPQATPAARPAPRQPQPAARPAPTPQRSQPAASSQRNTSGNDSRSTNRSRNRD